MARLRADPIPEGQASTSAGARRRAGMRLLHLDLPEWQVELIDREAAKLSMRRVQWVRALVAARLREKPAFERGDELRLIEICGQARAMREELGAIHRSIEARGPQDLSGVTHQIEAMRSELARLKQALRASFEGNLAYWRGDP